MDILIEEIQKVRELSEQLVSTGDRRPYFYLKHILINSSHHTNVQFEFTLFQIQHKCYSICTIATVSHTCNTTQ